jgi:hypothetical protein
MTIAFALAASLALAPPSAAADTVGPYDTPATRELVEFTIRRSGRLPADLWDYRARVRSLVQLSLGGDEEEGRELPVTADEFLSDVRWHATGRLEQRVVQHRMRVSVPTPYTIGSLLDDPWVIPHLYGSIGGIVTLAATPAGATRTEGRVVHPFSQLGPELYRYSAGDTVRIRIQNELVTVVPVSVRPRTGVAGDAQLLVGTFLVDVDRGAVARARFGVVERRRGVRVSDLGSFLELENMLWEGRYWLPFRQRQEIQLGSRLFGGTVGVRIVNEFTDLRINEGWQPETDGWILVRDAVTEEMEPLPRTAVGDDAGDYDITDFADLRRAATAAERGDLTGVRLGFHARRAGHIFRHNRVEGLFLGAGAILEPADPLDNRWDVYATGGYAFGENALRGEVTGRYRLTGTVPLLGPARTDLTAGVYRRLPDTRAFRPVQEWDWIYSLSSAFAGVDLRDYYDATGAEVGVAVRASPWRARLGLRSEMHDSVGMSVERTLFGGAARDYRPVAPVDAGRHTALEADLVYLGGAGAFGIGSGATAQLRGEWGVGDFDFGRLLGMVSGRWHWEPFALATRLDGAHTFGEPPLQRLVRFGGTEGLRGYGDNVFGGTTAALGRGRFLVGLPPRSASPIRVGGGFALPPIRPAAVLLAEAGWSEVREGRMLDLARVGARPTEGWRGSVGAGLSFFDDVLTIEWLTPLDDEGAARWYLGVVTWF